MAEEYQIDLGNLMGFDSNHHFPSLPSSRLGFFFSPLFIYLFDLDKFLVSNLIDLATEENWLEGILEGLIFLFFFLLHRIFLFKGRVVKTDKYCPYHSYIWVFSHGCSSILHIQYVEVICMYVLVYVCVYLSNQTENLAIFHFLGWGFEFFVHFIFYMISYVLEMGIQKCLKYGYKLQGNLVWYNRGEKWKSSFMLFSFNKYGLRY